MAAQDFRDTQRMVNRHNPSIKGKRTRWQGRGWVKDSLNAKRRAEDRQAHQHPDHLDR